MRISVGSKNPVKIAAVKNAVNSLWVNADVVAVAVGSGVSEQPMSDDEAINGAATRARLSLEKADAHLGVGLEGCTIDTMYGMFVTGWAAVVDKTDKIGIGGGGRLLLPEKIASEVRKGKELGPLMDEFTGECNVKQKQGAVGVLTNNLVLRASAFEQCVIYALARFITDYYEG